MLEQSLYGGAKPQDALSRYLANVGAPAAGKPPKTPGAPPNLDGVSTSDVVGPGVPAAGGGSTYMVPGFSTNPDGSPMSSTDISTAAAGNKAPPAPSISTDYSSDPILQQIISGGIKDESTAEAQALAARRNALAQYGDPDLARAVLGAGDPTIGSISEDPNASTSTLARINKGYADTVHQTTEDDNVNNLFYGGAHLKNLQDDAQQETTQKADANAAVQQALDQIAGGLSTTQGNIQQSRIQGEQDAANRAASAAILAALTGGLGGAGASSGGGAGPAVTPPPAAGDTFGSDPAAAAGGVFDPLNNLSPADWQKIANLPVNRRKAAA